MKVDPSNQTRSAPWRKSPVMCNNLVLSKWDSRSVRMMLLSGHMVLCSLGFASDKPYISWHDEEHRSLKKMLLVPSVSPRL
jgi:hypothetical protein